jgi:hypothetical protein
VPSSIGVEPVTRASIASPVVPPLALPPVPRWVVPGAPWSKPPPSSAGPIGSSRSRL